MKPKIRTSVQHPLRHCRTIEEIVQVLRHTVEEARGSRLRTFRIVDLEVHTGPVVVLTIAATTTRLRKIQSFKAAWYYVLVDNAVGYRSNTYSSAAFSRCLTYIDGGPGPGPDEHWCKVTIAHQHIPGIAKLYDRNVVNRNKLNELKYFTSTEYTREEMELLEKAKQLQAREERRVQRVLAEGWRTYPQFDLLTGEVSPHT